MFSSRLCSLVLCTSARSCSELFTSSLSSTRHNLRTNIKSEHVWNAYHSTHQSTPLETHSTFGALCTSILDESYARCDVCTRIDMCAVVARVYMHLRAFTQQRDYTPSSPTTYNILCQAYVRRVARSPLAGRRVFRRFSRKPRLTHRSKNRTLSSWRRKTLGLFL